MRIVGEIPHTDCKITLFNWNNRYLVKLEKGYLEQTFKIDQFELASDGDLKRVVSDHFIQAALVRFTEMEESLKESLEAL